MQKDANLQQEKIDELKRQIKSGKIELRPFSNKNGLNIVIKIHHICLHLKSGHDDEIEVVEIQTPVDEEAKDPQLKLKRLKLI